MDNTSQKLKQNILISRANAAAAKDGASHISGQQSLRSSVIRNKSIQGSQMAHLQNANNNSITAARLMDKLS